MTQYIKLHDGSFINTQAGGTASGLWEKNKWQHTNRQQTSF